MKIKECFIGFMLCFVLVFGAQAAQIVKIQNKSGKELIIFDVPNNKTRKVFTLPSPNRLVVDVPSIAGKHKIRLPKNYRGKLIKSLRFGQFNKRTSRFVFDLKKKIRILSVRADSKRIFIEIDDKAKKNKKAQKRHKAKKLPLIVIDAGHGGVDPGAIGKRGIKEKTVVLRYAKSLKAKLLKTKKYRVLLTRSNDKFIALRNRVAIARKAKASLFISLHADSAKDRSARGLSVYTVSEKASDKEAESLAARENKSDIIGGMDLSAERADVTDILISLAQRETKNNSVTLADFLVANLNNKVRMLPNSHRFAGFAVLKAPDIPSVLIEIGFLSHRYEEREITKRYYRNNVVKGITSGIGAYFRKKASFGTAGL